MQSFPHINVTNLVLTFLFLTSALWADPWGKDADLAYRQNREQACSERCTTPLFGPFAEVMIKFHCEVISPCDGPRSHFIPSSSYYTLDAMRKYGFFQGFAMGCDRLMRENDEEWVYQKRSIGDGTKKKYDPVK